MVVCKNAWTYLGSQAGILRPSGGETCAHGRRADFSDNDSGEGLSTDLVIHIPDVQGCVVGILLLLHEVNPIGGIGQAFRAYVAHLLEDASVCAIFKALRIDFIGSETDSGHGDRKVVFKNLEKFEQGSCLGEV